MPFTLRCLPYLLHGNGEEIDYYPLSLQNPATQFLMDKFNLAHSEENVPVFSEGQKYEGKIIQQKLPKQCILHCGCTVFLQY